MASLWLFIGLKYELNQLRFDYVMICSLLLLLLIVVCAGSGDDSVLLSGSMQFVNYVKWDLWSRCGNGDWTKSALNFASVYSDELPAQHLFSWTKFQWGKKSICMNLLEKWQQFLFHFNCQSYKMNLQKTQNSMKLNCLVAEKCVMRDVIKIYISYAEFNPYLCCQWTVRWRLFQNILRSILSALFFNVSVTNIFNAENSRILDKKWHSEEKKKETIGRRNAWNHKNLYNWMDVAHTISWNSNVLLYYLNAMIL